MNKKISVIIPARNEAESLKVILPEIARIKNIFEIIVVDDASEDNTAAICADNNVKIVSHVYHKGNGASIKSGARKATGEYLVFMDADGQHEPKNITALLNELDNGYDMVIGARERDSHASLPRYIANLIYNKFASYMSGHEIMDLTSGFRAVKSTYFKKFLYLLPNGFSYPTTITMAFFRSGFSIKYIPIDCPPRIGSSHIRLIKDGIKFFLIIFRLTSLYSPLKIFAPISLMLFITGIGYYGYTYIYAERFTNMSILFLLTSVIIFMIGLLAEQITFLIYSESQKQDD
ncbi:MAG: glycosyltransferase family 2 protein [Gammaproteobacteria bacterium]|nr:MAG: glycosyltransferase family 2 protein [Gammaproteobacteria bacterium]